MIQALFAKSYLKTYQGIFYAFMLPTFLLLIFHFIKIVPPGGYGDGPIVVVSSFVLLPALTIGVTSVPNVITEWKESILMKRIDSLPIRKSEFIFSLILFFTFTSILAMLWLVFLISMLCIGNSQQLKYGDLQKIDWGLLVLTGILICIVTCSLGVLIGGIMETNELAQAVTLVIFFPSVLLAGIMVPMQVLLNQVDPSTTSNGGAMRYIMYFIPFVGCSFMNQIAYAGGNVPDSLSNVHLFNNQWGYAVLATLLWSVLFIVIAIFTFKLTPRKG